MRIEALFHDMTLDYLRPAEPDKNRNTQVRFRAYKGDTIKINLVWGNERLHLRHTETDGEFDYYDISVNTGSDAVSYYFEILAEDGNTYFYDKRGCTQNIYDPMKFRIFPGFSTPNWAKGAVMYQILVDRFCNGDKSNDVLTGEYQYYGKKSVKVKSWEQYPDPKFDFGEFYGGDLEGVLDKLDYLQDLGSMQSISIRYLFPLLHTSMIYRIMII